jgi:hypothetical protein
MQYTCMTVNPSSEIIAFTIMNGLLKSDKEKYEDRPVCELCLFSFQKASLK